MGSPLQHFLLLNLATISLVIILIKLIFSRAGGQEFVETIWKILQHMLLEDVSHGFYGVFWIIIPF